MADQETIKVYERLGKSYLNTVKDLTPPEIEDFIKLLPERARILDVGCAGGRDSKLLSDLGFEVIGIDLVDEFLSEAKNLVPEGEFIKMDVEELNFSANTFDAIWAGAVLLHVRKSKLPKLLKNLHNILRPKGKLFVGLKEGRGEMHVKDQFSPKHSRFFAFYSESEIKKILASAGFKVLFTKHRADNAGREEVKCLSIAAERE